MGIHKRSYLLLILANFIGVNQMFSKANFNIIFYYQNLFIKLYKLYKY